MQRDNSNSQPFVLGGRKWQELAQNIIDLHVHASPCIYDRRDDELGMSKEARSLGYRGILFKCHHTLNADRAFLIRKAVPGMEIHGGLVLSHFVGGLNPSAVEAAIISGAKEVWMPVFDSAYHIKRFGSPGIPAFKPVRSVRRVNRQDQPLKGISILDKYGEIVPEVSEILGMIADADIILATGHLSLEEIFPLIEAAKKAAVKKILVTHAEHAVTGWSVQDQLTMANKGAIIEHCYATANLDKVAKALNTVGPARCVMVTDGGSTFLPHPLDMMRLFIESMLRRGLTENDIEIMTKRNPSALLGLT